MSRRRRVLDLTEELVARVERLEPDFGPEPGLRPMTDTEFDQAADTLLAQKGAGPFWIFAYGSLIWKPEFDHVEARSVTAHGWRRNYCLDIDRWRGTPDQPGLMLALSRGGACRGVAYRLPEEDPRGQMLRLLRREAAYQDDVLWMRWITCRGTGETIRALTFYAEPADDPTGYAIHLPLDEQVRRLARAAGHWGSCAAYLHNTVRHLEELGIRDSYLWRLQRLVAAEIAAMPPLVRQ